MDNSRSVGLVPLYRKKAKRYDRSSLLLYFAGFCHWACRKRAIQSLALINGDTVVNLTDAMLDEANARVATHGWSNVELVKGDSATYVFPPAVDGILSTFALTLVSASSSSTSKNLRDGS